MTKYKYLFDLKFYRYSFPIITNNEVRADCISHLSAAVAWRDKKGKLYDSNNQNYKKQNILVPLYKKNINSFPNM